MHLKERHWLLLVVLIWLLLLVIGGGETPSFTHMPIEATR